MCARLLKYTSICVRACVYITFLFLFRDRLWNGHLHGKMTYKDFIWFSLVWGRQDITEKVSKTQLIDPKNHNFGTAMQWAITVHVCVFPSLQCSIEYWFRCLDIDGDGVLSLFWNWSTSTRRCCSDCKSSTSTASPLRTQSVRSWTWSNLHVRRKVRRQSDDSRP